MAKPLLYWSRSSARHGPRPTGSGEFSKILERTMGPKALISLEDYERLPDDGTRYEIDEGELVPVSFASKRHSKIQHRILYLLAEHVQEQGLGSAYVQMPYLLAAEPPTLRAPDVSFLTAERDSESPDERYFHGAPELAVEIVSPSDCAADIVRKTNQYLAAGSLAVWVVYPDEREVHVRDAAAARVLRDGDTIEGIGPLAGFSAPVSSFFDEPRRK